MQLLIQELTIRSPSGLQMIPRQLPYQRAASLALEALWQAQPRARAYCEEYLPRRRNGHRSSFMTGGFRAILPKVRKASGRNVSSSSASVSINAGTAFSASGPKYARVFTALRRSKKITALQGGYEIRNSDLHGQSSEMQTIFQLPMGPTMIGRPPIRAYIFSN